METPKISIWTVLGLIGFAWLVFFVGVIGTLLLPMIVIVAIGAKLVYRIRR